MSVIFPPAILGWKWLRQFYGRLAFFGSFCCHAHKIPPFRGVGLELLGGGVEVSILFLWAWGFSDPRVFSEPPKRVWAGKLVPREKS